MEELERKRAALEAKLAELERALGQAMRDLQAARADPMRRIAAHECYEKIWAEHERVRAEIEALRSQTAAKPAPTRRARKRDGNADQTN